MCVCSVHGDMCNQFVILDLNFDLPMILQCMFSAGIGSLSGLQNVGRIAYSVLKISPIGGNLF